MAYGLHLAFILYYKILFPPGKYIGNVWCSDECGWAIKFINAVKALNANMNIPTKLSGIQKDDIPALAKHAAKEANPLYPVPKLMTVKELEQFYYHVADWS